MRNIKLVIEYDGTDFLGWQIQAEGRTVQGEITTVLEQVLQEPINLIGAGRTDSGVHARGQVANFRTNSVMRAGAIQSALNGLLPADIIVLSSDEVPESFHSRYDACERVYRYHLSLRPTAVGRQYSWYVRSPLRVAIMQEAASTFVGLHDFEAMSKSGELDHHRCDVRKSFWKECVDGLVYEIRSDRFVRGMVRSLVGTMVDLGRGAMSWEDFRVILDSKDRSRGGMAAPPHGLFLEEVAY